MLNRILNIVGWLGTTLVMGAVAVRFLRPEWQQYAVWAAWSGLVCVLLYTLGQWRDVVRAFQRRQARYGGLAFAGIGIVLAILVAINYVAARQNKRWDLTTGQAFSLSDQTKKVLQSLDAPVKILVFDKDPDFGRFRDRLREYEYVSKNVAVEYIDADKKPAEVKQYEVQSYGTVVIEYKGRTERVTSDSEQDLTNGLIKATTGAQKKVYFLGGHGERDTTSAERTGYNGIAGALGRDNFGIEKLVLVQKGEIPADASMLVIAGPTQDYFAAETDLLRTYLQKGGKVLCMIDPFDRPSHPPLTNLETLLKEWAIEIGNNIVVDASGLGRLIGADASVPVAASYPTHPITERFNVLTAYPLARSVTPLAGGTNGRTAQTVVETSPNSWTETDIQALTTSGQVAFDEAKGDRKGPISIAAAARSLVMQTTPADKGGEDKDADKTLDMLPETRLIVVGDSDFASNSALPIGGNSDMFMNMVNWLARQENLIAIRPKQSDDRRITLSADQRTRIIWLSLIIIPGLILGSGVLTWWQRR